ncbi:MAG: GNAT family N-acetyltransferase [Myxococcota bacterium]
MAERLQLLPRGLRPAIAFPPHGVETGRLRLRRPGVKDAGAIFTAYASDPEVTRYLAWRPHRAVEDTQEFLAQCETAWETGVGHRPWVIEQRETGTVVGMIGVDVGPRGVDVGYVLARPCWGRGYMTEALRAVCEEALRDPAIHRVSGFCDAENRASARVMEKAGMQYEGTLRRYMHHVNVAPGPRDCHVFARVRSGWGLEAP